MINIFELVAEGVIAATIPVTSVKLLVLELAIDKASSINTGTTCNILPREASIPPVRTFVNATYDSYAYGLVPNTLASQAAFNFAIVSALVIAEAAGASLNAVFAFLAVV